jgi:hypothetical protein
VPRRHRGPAVPRADIGFAPCASPAMPSKQSGIRFDSVSL